MVKNTKAARRGRPQIRSDEETLRLIIEAASLEFQTRGYAGTAIDAVAQAAGVSTKTLYRLIPTKAALFKTVIADRIGRFMLDIDEAVRGCRDLATALEHILLAFGSFTLSENVIAITRLALGECDRFPELGQTFYEEAIRPTSEAMEAWLRRQCNRGLITLEDPHMATEMLRGMMVMEPQRAVMLGLRSAPDAAEIATRAKLCARLFLDGCRSADESARAG